MWPVVTGHMGLLNIRNVASRAEKLIFKLYFILINLNGNRLLRVACKAEPETVACIRLVHWGMKFQGAGMRDRARKTKMAERLI